MTVWVWGGGGGGVSSGFSFSREPSKRVCMGLNNGQMAKK